MWIVVGQSLSHVRLWDPVDYSMPGFPVLHNSQSLLKFMSIELWCHPSMSSSATHFSSCPQSFPGSESFPMSQLFTSGGQSTGASALALALPMNIQGWFPLGLTGLRWTNKCSLIFHLQHISLPVPERSLGWQHKGQQPERLIKCAPPSKPAVTENLPELLRCSTKAWMWPEGSFSNWDIINLLWVPSTHGAKGLSFH